MQQVEALALEPSHMRVYLFNDTSSEHAGCRAVMESLARALGGHEIIQRHEVGGIAYDPAAMDACDAVLVNGEGTLHYDAGRYLMEMLALGQRLGKRNRAVVQTHSGSIHLGTRRGTSRENLPSSAKRPARRTSQSASFELLRLRHVLPLFAMLYPWRILDCSTPGL
jgi:hypothetical protein